ncbi:protein indeterminate-domain 7-like [Cucurbita pepo subsp. pepo]|uniref:protein indeterminate-domain 7-like n=1 Tax=Cucurbita pepo subsp. pepo TaxID=3664 RepID=UPI000C9D699B|nr:protein indeterminate-domain 7-like [Cucurbita pepo subsp. pepo]
MIKSLLFQAQAMEENLSNLTSASGEASSCSGNRSDQIPTNYSGGNYFSAPPPPPKRKRNLPGNPDPDAEVVALSPKTLMATNRFVCEICNKGFQRDQNLQLHRRGHNLPWKLKPRANKEVIRKKVYVCPETSCVHHDPSRALGDLTGIKKHFSRKHGEKKWKCDKCSKRYAVQSDWKAHSKTCGTREYRCDCGTLFSRRDSFITHRAFCDALAEESARSITANPILMTNNNPPLLPNPISSISHFNFQPQTHFNPLDINSFALKKEHQNPQSSTNFIPPWLANHNQDLNHLIINPNHLGQTSLNLPTASSSPSPHMSATALLQKAAQMGATMSSNNNAEAPHTIIRPQHSQDHHVSDSSATTNNATCNFGLNLSSSSSSRDNQNQVLMGTEAGPGLSPALPLYRNKTLVQTTFMNNNNNTTFSPSAFEGASFEIDEFGGMLKKDEIFNDNPASEGLSTRDFLGLRAMSHTEFLSNIAAAGYGNCINGGAGQTPPTQIRNQPSWQG